ncbi:MAG: 2OG-Fe(II) oxygenase [Candidatus Sericytochromatia bacterium]
MNQPFADSSHPLAKALNALVHQRLLLLLPGWLDASSCKELLRQLQSCPTSPAEAESYGANAQARRTQMLDVPASIESGMVSRFEPLAAQLGSHFGLTIGSHERPQFLKYGPGDFFSAQRDRIDAPVYRERRLSLVLFLNDHESQPGFAGGRLSLFVKHPQDPEKLMGVPIPPAAGLLMAFDSRLLHEVTPVTAGERFTMVTWLAV